MQNKAGVGGIMLWDLSWDQNSVINNRRYSEYAFEVLPKDPSVITTTKPMQTQESTTTSAQDSTTPLSTTTAVSDSTASSPLTQSTTTAPVSPTTTSK